MLIFLTRCSICNTIN
ncbi:MAG TPA: hypothetical protein DCK79_10915 [Candidatus Atribacteria bacterium]|nr:hypothetical protein [Candidatus Atribacteria bacterium]